MQDLLNGDLLSNVFQYPTEKDLYEYGMAHRGIYERIQLAKLQLLQVGDLISDGNAKLSQKYQVRIAWMGAAIAIVQFYQVIKDLCCGDPDKQPVMAIIILIIILALSILIFLRWDNKPELGKKIKYEP